MTSSQAHFDVPEELWFLCPQAHTVLTSKRLTLPPEVRPKLHYIYTHPFRKWADSFDQSVLAFILRSLLSKWDKEGPANRNCTFSIRFTDLSWQAQAEMCGTSITSRVRSTLVRWKDFVEKYQVEVLDGYEVDIRDVAIPLEGLDESNCYT